MNQIILVAMIILPWVSVFFMDRYSLKRFMPVAILASLLVTIIFEIGYVYDWWKIQSGILPWDIITSVPLTYGIFLVGTLWIFHLTFDRGFWTYLITNILFDGFYSFIILNVLIWFGIYRLVNMGNFGIFMLMFMLSLIIYLYQKWQEGVIENKA